MKASGATAKLAAAIFCWLMPAAIRATSSRRSVAAAFSAQQQQEEVPYNHQCDESKCRSPGLFGGTDCWALGPDTNKPSTCADGYEARNLSNIATYHEPEANVTYWYYACCPPGYSDPIPQEECTDQVCTSPNGEGGIDCWADAPFEPMTCRGDVYRFPRHTTLKYRFFSRWYYFYVCCKTDDGTPPLQSTLFIGDAIKIVLACLATCFALSLILGILSCRRARSSSFNLYLVVLTIPDAAVNILAMATGSAVISGMQVSYPLMFFTSFFHTVSNIWLNAIVAHEIYFLLRSSHSARRVEPPSIKRVCVQTTVVYFVAILVGVWCAFLLGGRIFGLLGYKNIGMAAFGLTWAFVAVVPMLYMVYICIYVWMEKLLSLSPRTRVLSIYFFRVIVVYFVFWIPTIILRVIEPKNVDWEGLPLNYFSWYLDATQTVASVAMALTKPDVYSATKNFLLCSCRQGDSDHDGNEGTLFRDQLSSALPAPMRRSSEILLRASSMIAASFRRSTLDIDEAGADNCQVSVMNEEVVSSGDHTNANAADEEDVSKETA